MDSLSVYRDLADCYDRLGQVSMRDRFLILAADAALEAGQPAEAERLRQRLLQGSRHHMLRPYSSFAEAASGPDVQTYLRDLRLNYPLDVAEQLLDSLQGNAEKPGAPAPQAQPANWGPPIAPEPPIPPTAPLVDLARRPIPQPGDLAGGQQQQQRSAPRPASLPEPYTLRDEPAPRPPLALPGQPLPGRLPMSRRSSVDPPADTPLEQTQPLPPPVAPPRPAANPGLPRRLEPALASPAFPAPLPPRPRETETHSPGGVWLHMLLVGVVGTAGLALAAFTLARPFLPDAWLK
jgi:hypothetical protein